MMKMIMMWHFRYINRRNQVPRRSTTTLSTKKTLLPSLLLLLLQLMLLAGSLSSFTMPHLPMSVPSNNLRRTYCYSPVARLLPLMSSDEVGLRRSLPSFSSSSSSLSQSHGTPKLLRRRLGMVLKDVTVPSSLNQDNLSLHMARNSSASMPTQVVLCDIGSSSSRSRSATSSKYDPTAITQYEVSQTDPEQNATSVMDSDRLAKIFHRQSFVARYGSKTMNRNSAIAASRRKYKRKRIPDSEREIKTLRKQRQAEYDRMINTTNGILSIWSFESLFPEPVWDELSVRRDLYGESPTNLKEGRKLSSTSSSIAAGQPPRSRTWSPSSISLRDPSNDKSGSSSTARNKANHGTFLNTKMKSSWYGGNSMMRIWRDPKQMKTPVSSFFMFKNDDSFGSATSSVSSEMTSVLTESVEEKGNNAIITNSINFVTNKTMADNKIFNYKDNNEISLKKVDMNKSSELKIDRDLTRMVEDRVYGYRRLQTGEFRYETSLMGDGAVKFRNGIRLGNPLRVNADRLNYLAKKEMMKGRVEEASEFYERAVDIDPRDGRAYLGLSRCAERRRDFKLARKWLQLGVSNSVSLFGDQPDRGANPFLLQAMGCLEEKMGNLAAAESLYILAVKSRPTHAAAWVSLSQLRTGKLGQPLSSGRACFQIVEQELEKAGLLPSSYVYTAWAALERKAGDLRTARKLFNKAIEVDSRCSAAWLQLGVLEADAGNWDEAEKCFKTVLKYDQRNSRVLQAYALAEAKKPISNSRNAIELFERALKVNPRDAGVLQAYALYVAELGDVQSARVLLRRGTEVNKRHAAVWQAWGVLETRHGNFDAARKIFQEGIWTCGQLTGSQSGGYDCARLWQAWGVLEAQCKDYAAARRCFSRALDANKRNVPAVTAWALMEEEIGNIVDARMIFERALKNFAAGSNEKIALWRNYELMEQRSGDVEASKAVFQRCMKETLTIKDEQKDPAEERVGGSTQKDAIPELIDVLATTNRNKKSKGEFEVLRWESSGGEIWMNDKSIESKINIKNRLSRKKATTSTTER